MTLLFLFTLLLLLLLPASSLTLRQKAGQLLQISIANIVGTDDDGNPNTLVIDEVKLKYYLDLNIGSFLDSPTSSAANPISSFPATEYTKLRPDYLMSLDPDILSLPIFAIDSIHGATYFANSTILPQPINLAATFNPTHSSTAGRVAALQTLSLSHNSYTWIFSPLLGTTSTPLWSRLWETYGSSPLLSSRFAAACISGIEATGVISTAKHYRGYPRSPTSGDRVYPVASDGRDAVVWSDVLATAPPSSIMTSYTSINGRVPTTSDARTLAIELRGRSKFEGVVVTDYNEVGNLVTWHNVAATLCDGVVATLRGDGVDLLMVPFNPEGVIDCVVEAVEKGTLKESDVDRKVERIGRLKEAGLRVKEQDTTERLETEEQVDLAMESITLLKNENDVLPLAPHGLKIAMAGPTADSIGRMCGGWTLHWQGGVDDGEFWEGQTLRAAVEEFAEVETCSICTTAELAGSDYVIIGIGEEAYTEKPGDIRDGGLPEEQIQLIDRVAAVGSKIIAVYIGGRPRIFPKGTLDKIDALVMAYLPGPHGGSAIARVLFGPGNPSGRLPFDWPMYQDNAGAFDRLVTEKCTAASNQGHGAMPSYDYEDCSVEFAFGAGLSFTTFSHELGEVSSATISRNENVTLDIVTTNTGSLRGKTSVLGFSFVPHRIATPRVKELFDFAVTPELDPGESFVTTLVLDADHLTHLRDDPGFAVLEDGMSVLLGVGPSVDCRLTSCPTVTVTAANNNEACEYACDVWARACPLAFGSQDCDEYCHKAPTAWTFSYVRCIEEVYYLRMHEADKGRMCFELIEQCRDIFSLSGGGGGDYLEKVIAACNGGDAHCVVQGVGIGVGWIVGVSVVVGILTGWFVLRRGKGGWGGEIGRESAYSDVTSQSLNLSEFSVEGVDSDDEEGGLEMK